MPDLAGSGAASSGYGSGTQYTNPTQADRGTTNISIIQAVLDLGMRFQGVKYVWGGASPNGFDCSGLLQYIFAKNGITIPRVSKDQAAAGPRVAARDARPGDLISFDYSSTRPGIDHIGIYLGNGKMLHAPKTGDVVKVVNVDLNRAAAITRVAPDSAFGSLRQPDGKFVYSASLSARTAGSASPATTGPAAGGGDPGNAPRPAGGESLKIEDALTGLGAMSGYGTGPSGQYRLEDYGFSAAFFGSDPQLKGLVDRAVSEQWSPSKFAIEIKNTDWFKTRSEADRNWTIIKTGDPGEAARKIDSRVAELRLAAGQMGAKLTDDQFRSLAENSLKFGYNSAEIQQNLAGYIKLLPGYNDMVGDSGKVLDEFRQKALAFGLTIPDGRLADFVQRVMAGTDTEESFDRWIKEQAKALYPTLAGQIDKGLTVEDLAANYKQIMSNSLELDPNSVDLKDPLLREALFQQSPDAKGEPKPMSLWEFEQRVRKDARWMKTKNARDTMMSATAGVLRDFGFKY